jgi:hypothetical protein
MTTLHDVGEAVGRLVERFDALAQRRHDARAPRSANPPDRIPVAVERALELIPGLRDQVVRDLRLLVREWQNLSSSREGAATARKVEKLFDKIDVLAAAARHDIPGIAAGAGARDRLSPAAEHAFDGLPGLIAQLKKAASTLVKAYNGFDRETEFGKAVRSRISQALDRVSGLVGMYAGTYGSATREETPLVSGKSRPVKSARQTYGSATREETPLVSGKSRPVKSARQPVQEEVFKERVSVYVRKLRESEQAKNKDGMNVVLHQLQSESLAVLAGVMNEYALLPGKPKNRAKAVNEIERGWLRGVRFSNKIGRSDSEAGNYGAQLKAAEENNEQFDALIAKIRADRSVTREVMNEIHDQFMGYRMTKSTGREEMLKRIINRQMVSARSRARAKVIKGMGTW